METLEACPQFPNIQATEDAKKTLLNPSLLACPENHRFSEDVGEMHLALSNSSALLQVTVEILVRHLTCSRTHLTPERC